jgi:hypothetical protein
MAKGREWGRLYKQRRSRFWWYRIGFQGRIICASTKTADKRQAAEVLKTKRQELEAARGGFTQQKLELHRSLPQFKAGPRNHERRGVSDVGAASPFRLPRRNPGIGL